MALRGAARSLVGHARGRRLASGSSGSFWGPGKDPPGEKNGYLFGETPPPEGQARVRESWELPWYLAFGSAAVILAVGLNAKPQDTVRAQARKEAREELDRERGG